MIRKLTGVAIAAAALAATALTAPSANAQNRTEAGVLTCHVAGGVGFVFGSTKDLRCVFENAHGIREDYTGTVRKFGIDIGATAESVIVWAVLAPTSQLPPKSLAGHYGGVSAEATVGVGLGANALVGGSNQNIVLQPVSVQAQAGLNIAAGVAEITLTPQ